MKGFIQRHVWLSAVVGFVLALAMGSSAVFAAGWASTSMGVNVTGSVTINPATLPTLTYSYTLPSTTVNFHPITLQAGEKGVLVSDPILITNTGTAIFTGVMADATTRPAALTITGESTGNYIYAGDGSVSSFVITLDVTASTTPQTVNLSSMVLTILPEP